ncbi:MAG: serine/threonine protein kinase, partial [Proteobacteria bacterium]|nr:serine/threonine protein kinase [Pseudomonadota bacterium]
HSEAEYGSEAHKHVIELETPVELADRYTFTQVLGEGSQGKVYLASRRSDGKKVAIKQLRIDSVKTWKEYTLFHREADVLASLDIPGVVKLYEACDYLEANPPCSYIVQEYVEGETLKKALASGYRFSLNRAYELVLQLIDILEKLHSHEPPIIHRDIKPSNIILKNLDSDRFTVSLIDFGAVSNPKVQSGGSTVAGTFGYMSPEQMIGRATPQSDTYALAAMFAYIISGVEPAEMKTQDLRLVIDPYVENHPVALVQTLRRMLEPDIGNRLADLGELRRRFTAFKEGRYVLENENYRRLSKADLSKRFKQVKHLCQPQNMEIWHDLPDLPENRDDFPIKIYTNPRFLNYPCKVDKENEDEPKLSVHNKISRPIRVIFFMFIVMIALGVSMAVLDPDKSRYMIYVFIFPFIILLLSPIWIAIINFAKKLFRKKDVKGRLPWIKDRHHVNRFPCNHHLELIKNGRKTIATISDIVYIQSRLIRIKHVEEPPKFRIYYKFNPPDDDCENDLIHYVDTHRDPEGLFKVGDPLPILYCGTQGAGQVLHVTESMPYPFPLDDLEVDGDYIGYACNSAPR